MRGGERERREAEAGEQEAWVLDAPTMRWGRPPPSCGDDAVDGTASAQRSEPTTRCRTRAPCPRHGWVEGLGLGSAPNDVAPFPLSAGQGTRRWPKVRDVAHAIRTRRLPGGRNLSRGRSPAPWQRVPVPGTWRDTLRRSSDGPAGGAAGPPPTRTGGLYRNGRAPVRTSARARHPVLGVLGVLGVLNPPVRTRTRAPPPWDWSLDAAVAVRRAHRRSH